MNTQKKTLKKTYLETPRRMGVFQIRNLINDRVFVGATLNLDAIFNRHSFQLRMGKHRNKSLQDDWNHHGSQSFVFEVLDELTPKDGKDHDYREDIALLEKIWLEKLNPYDGAGYNERKKGPNQLLREMAERRSNAE